MSRFISHIQSSVHIIITLLLGVFLFSAFNIYVFNRDEFTVGFANLASHLIVLILGITLVLAFLIAILPRVMRERVNAVLIALCLLCYIQSNFLNWDYGLLDGNEINWNSFVLPLIIDTSVWIVIIAFSLLYSAWFLKHSTKLLTLLLVIQILNAAFLSFQHSIRFQTERSLKDSEALYQFSSKSNVVFILLDAFASPAFEYLRDKNAPEIKEFDNFTYFKNTLASFPTTSASIPAILTGQVYDNSIPINDFLRDSLTQKSLPSYLKQSGYNVSLVTLSHYCNFIKSDVCLPLDQSLNRDYFSAEKRDLMRLEDVALFRSMPHFVKPFIFNDHNWLLQPLLQTRKGPAIHVNSIDIVDSFVRHASVTSPSSTFKLLHLQIPHPPLALDENCDYTKKFSRLTPENFSIQSRCALKLTGDVIRKMKEMGVYDNSLIVVSADHGLRVNFGHYKKEPGQYEIAKALPLLLIKPPNSKTPLLVSEAPAQLTDLAKTVLASLSEKEAFPGKDVFSLNPQEPRERLFSSYSWKHEFWNKEFLPTLTKWYVNGDAWDIKSWSKRE